MPNFDLSMAISDLLTAKLSSHTVITIHKYSVESNMKYKVFLLFPVLVSQCVFRFLFLLIHGTYYHTEFSHSYTFLQHMSRDDYVLLFFITSITVIHIALLEEVNCVLLHSHLFQIIA